MTRLNARATEDTRLIEKVLGKEFAHVSAYRYNPAVIRIRIVDPRFAGKDLAEREQMVEPLLCQLPEAVYCDITLLLTLAPGEEDDSFANYEFEHAAKSSV
ncbi:MAG: hypothetical protein PHU85_05380 [Phycisphaerae bacterium]|nr:hypothetical protein [Phycisphaerae bacterium]